MPLIIAEYQQISHGGRGDTVQAAEQPTLAVQSVSVNQASSTFQGSTNLVECYFTEDMHINFGEPGDASTADMLYTAGERIYFGIKSRGMSVDTAAP